MNRFFAFTWLLLMSYIIIAQSEALNWYLKSPKTTKVYGVGAEAAYELLKNKKPKEIVVGVIDSGVEVDHEDLKESMWINEDEIPNNGLDDDNNGYIDDIHGWSFLGGDSLDMNYEAFELARMYLKSASYFEEIDTTNLNPEDLKKYEDYLDLRKTYNEKQQELKFQVQSAKLITKYIESVEKQTGMPFSKKANKDFEPKNEMDTRLRKQMKIILMVVSADQLKEEMSMGLEMIEPMYNMNNTGTDSLRESVVGDNLSDVYEKDYGCNRYEGPDAGHGTHVSGIIAADANNTFGIKGIAPSAKIMCLRAVPNGDERDKDIANSIIYAVDNGAKVINMSFGKTHTPNKLAVDQAIQYAAKHDVLLIHAAGNDAKNLDENDFYPARTLNDGSTAQNWLEVGASSASKKGKKFVASFSNYGVKSVDLFSPGVNIYSTMPDNTYKDESGTSMAAPAAAGVAALIRAYFPELSAVEVKNVLMNSVEPYKKKVRRPGSKEKVLLSDLCISGGVISAENAIKTLLEQRN